MSYTKSVSPPVLFNVNGNS